MRVIVSPLLGFMAHVLIQADKNGFSARSIPFFIGVRKHKSLHPLSVRDEGLTRFVVPPWFGVE
jgi:hypothetical protein